MKFEEGLHTKLHPASFTDDDTAISPYAPAYVETFNIKNGKFQGDYIVTYIDKDGKVTSTETSTYDQGVLKSQKTVEANGAVSQYYFDENQKWHGEIRQVQEGFRGNKDEVIIYQQVSIGTYDHDKPVGLYIEYSTYGSEDVYFVEPGSSEKTKAVREELVQLQFEDNRNTQLGHDKRTPVQQMAARAEFLHKKYNAAM